MTITVTNQSSRSFILGGVMILPHVPQEISEEVKFAIDASPYHSFFTYEVTEDVPEGQEQKQEEVTTEQQE